MRPGKNRSSSSITFSALVHLQGRKFFKSWGNRLVLISFLLAGLYGLRQGYVDKRLKTTTIDAFRKQSDSLVQSMKAGIAADTTKADGKAAYQRSSQLNSGLWNTRLPSFKMPVSAAIYNIGQGDVLPYYYLFTAENFEMQLMKQTEINNPLRSLAGHLDVTFWVVYLLPLMILLFCFSALSAERDNGNGRLIAAQGVTEKGWLQSRLVVVGLLALLLLALIMIVGAIVNAWAFDQRFGMADALFFFISVLYLLFWLALFYFLNGLRKSTAYNSLAGGIAWIGICLVVPVLISRLAALFLPIDNATISTYSRRPQDTHIEQDKIFAAGIIKKWAAAEPVYRQANADTSEPAFYLRTYHALHLLLHKERWPVMERYYRQIEKRQAVTNWSAFISPAGSTDGYFTALADNDARAYHRFTEQTEALHQRLHAAFFTSLFTKDRFGKSNYDALPQFNYSRSALPSSQIAYCIFLLTLILGLYRWTNRRLDQFTVF